MSDAGPATVSDILCRHVAGVRHEDLPAGAVAAAKRALLDATGVICAASGLSPEGGAFIRVAAATGEGPCAILGTRLRVTAPMAALANGALSHALDFEDAFDEAPGHPNASLVPALLALSQFAGPVDGRSLLTALAVGCDVANRMALALDQRMEAGGWYPPPILAAFGAAAGAARLLGLDARQVRDALSLTLCQAVTPGEIMHSPTTVIRAVREAFPAQAAVMSSLLARAGVAGFERPLEGEAGFYRLFAGGRFSAERLLDRLGERWTGEELTFKAWPACRGTHAYIEMALDVREALGGDVSGIASVEIDIGPVQRMLVAPAERKRAPQTVIDAKFSIPFALATALVRGSASLADFVPERLSDGTILAMAQKVAVGAEPDAALGGAGGRMRVRLADGGVLDREVRVARGGPQAPVSDAELADKFVDCLARAAVPRSPGQAKELASRLLALEDEPDVGALFS